MSKHTPGPWVANLTRIESKNEHGWVNGGWIIADCEGTDHEANARLIAAAPDLLEALVNLENDDGSIPDHAWKLVQAAIAKAKGEEQCATS